MARPSTAFTTAYTWIKKYLSSYHPDDTIKLPTLDECAFQAGVSQRTMVKAVNALKSEGILSVFQGKGIFRPGSAGRGKAQESRSNVHFIGTNAAERIASLIDRDIRQLGIPCTPLPSIKQLVHRYSSSYPTIRRALSILCRSGSLEPYKRGFHRIEPANRSRSRIYLLARGTEESQIWYQSSRTQDHLRLLQEECARRGVELSTVPVVVHDSFSEISRAWISQWNSEEPLGFFVWNLGIPDENTVLKQIVRYKKPIAILNETQGPLQSSFQPLSDIVRYTLSVGPNDGELMGKYLFGHGHREIAYLSPFGDESGIGWSKLRLQGLRRAFGRLGHVHTFEFNFSKDIASAMFDTRRLLVSAQSMLTQDPLRINSAAYAVQQRTEEILEKVNRAATGRYESSLNRIFDQALSHKNVTAWVGANDEVALYCLKYLQSKKVKVPGDISLVGFNDSIESFTNEITSFNFNAAAVMREALNFVLADRTRKKTGSRILEDHIPGFVIPRRSS